MPAHNLPAIRAAHVERIRSATARCEARDMEDFQDAIPTNLFYAGVWLYHMGWDGPAIAEETRYGHGPDTYRRFLANADAQQTAELIEPGRAAIFDGRFPIYREPIAGFQVERHTGCVHLGFDEREAA